jgi:hypothetical protein
LHLLKGEIMSTEAQSNANRRNAEKSTGPKTPEGKAVVAQNALTHGLSAEREILGFEDHSEYERHKEKVLGELKPTGYIEEMLAQRIVSLSWRVRRADRMQNAVMEYLAAKQTGGPSATEHALGKTVAKDFQEQLILNRMEMYEGRIERRLHKAMMEFQRWRLMQQKEDEEEASSVKCEVSSSDRALETSEQTPDGVATNEGGKTKPISKARTCDDKAVTALAGVKIQHAGLSGAAELTCETNPLHGDQGGSSATQRTGDGRTCNM